MLPIILYQYLFGDIKMAQLNTQEIEAVSNGKKKVTHFINLNIVKADGSHVRLGAIPVFENPDKAQRTLLKMVEDGVDVSALRVCIDVRANVKSEDVYEADDWLFVEKQVINE